MSLKVFLNGIEFPVVVFQFPGGEVGVKIPTLTSFGDISISAIINNSAEVMQLLMLTDAIRRQLPDASIELHMPYVPYARQDRVMVPGESLSIKVFCNLINSQNYNRVVIEDPHSDVTPALLNNCFVLTQAEILKGQLPFGETHRALGFSENRVSFIENTVLVAPDAGAMKKIGEVSKLIGFKDIVRADKIRDPATGKILETVVYSEHIGDRNFLIVDDICDKGGTFIALAKVLRPLTKGKIILYVTHAILPEGHAALKGVIDEMYCANSFGKYKDHHNLLES